MKVEAQSVFDFGGMRKIGGKFFTVFKQQVLDSSLVRSIQVDSVISLLYKAEHFEQSSLKALDTIGNYSKQLLVRNFF